jgi:hypothetical protein
MIPNILPVEVGLRYSPATACTSLCSINLCVFPCAFTVTSSVYANILTSDVLDTSQYRLGDRRFARVYNWLACLDWPKQEHKGLMSVEI